MKYTKALFACLAAGALACAMALTVWAADGSTRIHDEAGLFTEEEAAALRQQAETAIEKTGVDFLVLTCNDMSGRNRYDYVDDYYLEYGFASGNEDGVVLLIDMASRELHVMGTGSVERYFDNTSQVNRIADHVQDELASRRYYQAAQVFLEESHRYVLTKTHPWQARLQPVYILICAGVGLVGGAVVIGIMLLMHRTSLPKAPSAHAYYGQEGVQVTHQADIFIGTHTTRRPIPRDPPPGSGGGGGGRSFSGSSGGGRSFSGTSRKF